MGGGLGAPLGGGGGSWRVGGEGVRVGRFGVGWGLHAPKAKCLSITGSPYFALPSL